jgi:hypothetical protein
MKQVVGLIILLGCLTMAITAIAVENRGADAMRLPGGSRGEVPFPHYKHQDSLKDCQICHAVFPQQKGGIEKMKADGQLKPKYVMNRLCTKCHKEKKRAGEATGPITCKQCHQKN